MFNKRRLIALTVASSFVAGTFVAAASAFAQGTTPATLADVIAGVADGTGRHDEIADLIGREGEEEPLGHHRQG